MDFVGAKEKSVRLLRPVAPETASAKTPEAIALPEIYRFSSMMLTYLQRRGIHSNLIRERTKTGTIYESRRHHNCVL